MLAQNHSTWRSKLTTGAPAAESRHTTEAQRKHAARKAPATSNTTAAPTHMCSTCGRTFQAIHQSEMKSWSSLTTKDEHHHVMKRKQKKIKIELRIKLNYNTCNHYVHLLQILICIGICHLFDSILIQCITYITYHCISSSE